jgi:hypothetical protein
MASIKRLNSVVHSLAHHAVSALSYLHPHLAEACEDAGQTYAEIDLMQDEPCPSRYRARKPLQLAIGELKTFYTGLLESEGFILDKIERTNLLFSFDLARYDHYCSTCTARIQTKDGKCFEKTVNYLGNEVTRAAHNIPVNTDAMRPLP